MAPADLLGGQTLGLDEQGAELEAFAGCVEEGGRDADLSLLADERLDQSEVVVEQHRLDGVEQRIEADILGLKGGVDFVGLHVVQGGERLDEGGGGGGCGLFAHGGD